MDAVEVIECDENITISIYPDYNALDPRKDFDHVGKMVCAHGSYELGDEQITGDYSGWQEIADEIKSENDVVAMLPLYLYDHSGISMSTSKFGDPWDSGMVGLIYATREDAIAAWGECDDLEAKVLACLESEVAEYDQYLCGDVYGFVVTNMATGENDSCWGFYGAEYCIEEAKAVAKWMAEQNESLAAATNLPVQLTE